MLHSVGCFANAVELTWTVYRGRSCLLWAIVDEKSIARPREVLRMGRANLPVFASGFHQTRMPQIFVKTVLGQMVIDDILLHLNRSNIPFQGNRGSILQGHLPNLT